MSDDLDDTLGRILADAAAELDADAERGELLWTAPDGARGYGRQDGDDAVIVIALPEAQDFVHRMPGVNFADL